ncbi:MAG TPA: fumarate hydratase, partial [Actinobacteria bacterium]|nr:fumarate hydratase [Actinomycetes bacterium]HEX21725.1 fumarate hydratase [Actinomycetota bacterium]
DNASCLRMMKPTATREEIADFIVNTVKNKGSSACPPLFIGVGIGGSFDSVALLAKKALLRRFDQDNPNKVLAKFERELLNKINELGIGPGGLGGKSTALGVSVITAPTHMACLPVAINMGCNSLRSVEIKV